MDRPAGGAFRRVARRGACLQRFASGAVSRDVHHLLGELAAGFLANHDLDHFLRGIRVLMLPRQVAWEASRIERELRGARLGENDNWIAATARTWG